MNFKKSLIIGASVLTLAPIASATFVSGSVYADSVTNESTQVQNNEVKLSDSFTEQDNIYLDKLTKIYSEFSLTESGYLELNISDQELKESYSFTDEEIGILRESVDFQHQNRDKYYNYTENGSPTVTPYLHVSDWKVYFTYDDLVMYLSSAIQAGAPAVIATMASMGTMTATPGVGTIMGVLAGLYSAGTVIYEVTQALANKQGWYIGVDWNGNFPNPTTGFW